MKGLKVFANDIYFFCFLSLWIHMGSRVSLVTVFFLLGFQVAGVQTYVEKESRKLLKHNLVDLT